MLHFIRNVDRGKTSNKELRSPSGPSPKMSKLKELGEKTPKNNKNGAKSTFRTKEVACI